MPGFHAIAVATIKILWAIWLTIWILCAFGNKRTAYRQPFSQYLPFVLIAAAAVLLIQFIPHPMAPLLPATPAGDSVGVALCAAGFAWSVWARLVLGANWSGIITLKQNHELIQCGPYRITRHPIYTGLIAAIVGSVLAIAPTRMGAIVLIEITIILVIKLRQEEKMMLQHFPEAYPLYKAKVKAALIPLIW